MNRYASFGDACLKPKKYACLRPFGVVQAAGRAARAAKHGPPGCLLRHFVHGLKTTLGIQAGFRTVMDKYIIERGAENYFFAKDMAKNKY